MKTCKRVMKKGGKRKSRYTRKIKNNRKKKGGVLPIVGGKRLERGGVLPIVGGKRLKKGGVLPIVGGVEPEEAMDVNDISIIEPSDEETDISVGEFDFNNNFQNSVNSSLGRTDDESLENSALFSDSTTSGFNQGQGLTLSDLNLSQETPEVSSINTTMEDSSVSSAPSQYSWLGGKRHHKSHKKRSLKKSKGNTKKRIHKMRGGMHLNSNYGIKNPYPYVDPHE